MRRPIAISIAPNTERDDAHIALRQLIRPHRWSRNAARRQQNIEQTLQRVLGQPEVILTSSGRGALTRLLQAAGIGQGDEVILQAFTCLVVPNAIRAAGARPVYADINPATYNLDPADVAKKITPRTKAIIIQHTFGIPADIEQLLRSARQHQLMIIEDCAHALGGTYDGQPLGSFGDAAIASFGRDKVISCVFGGAVAVRNAALASTVRRQEQSLPLPPRRWALQQLLHPLLCWYVILPFYFLGGIGKLKLVTWQRLGLLSRAVTPAERRGQPPALCRWRFSPALLPLLERQLEKLPQSTQRRTQLAARYAAAAPAALPAGDPSPLLRFPLRVDNPRRLLAAGRRHKMLLGDWYAAPVIPQVAPEISGYTPGSCPQAEVAAAAVINLPTYPRLTDEQVEQVIALAQR